MSVNSKMSGIILEHFSYVSSPRLDFSCKIFSLIAEQIMELLLLKMSFRFEIIEQVHTCYFFKCGFQQLALQHS